MSLDAFIAELEALRRKVCLYGPDAPICDCKFYEPGVDGIRSQSVFGSGEVSGCPELRTLIDELKSERGGRLLADLRWHDHVFRTKQ